MYSSASAGVKEGWVLLSSDGVQFLLGVASLQFARPPSCALRTFMGVGAEFSGSAPCDPAVADRGRHSPCCSTKWSADLPKRCSAQENLSAETGKFPVLVTPKILSSRQPRSPHCGSCERCSGPRGSPNKPLEDLPAEVPGQSMASMFGYRADGRSEASAGAVPRLRCRHERGLCSI